MIISTSLLKKALNDRAKASKRQSEGYTSLESTNAGMSLGFATGFLIMATVFVLLELMVLFYSINIAMNCTEPGPARIVNMVLAIAFTFPYALLNMIFVPCAKKTLGMKMSN
tara:strand:+ start:587 stop:922 length:336 start_codon:yes stop_codon:yes gene_type:complete